MLQMSSQMLQRVLCEISGTLESCEIPYSLTGAFALKLYGIPQFPIDLELFADKRDREELTTRFEKVNFHCCNKTDIYSRFESENDICGRVECMFTSTRDGREILDRRRYTTGPGTGTVPVVQPTDYIVLKLMSMANQPGGRVEDEADIRSVLERYQMDRMPTWCGPLDKNRIKTFAGKLGQQLVVEKIFKEAFTPVPLNEMAVL
jgi:hypothetical protein